MITINLSFYNQNEILRKHVELWNTYPDEIKEYFTFFIIDDCSKNNALDILKDIDLSNLNIHIYRVLEDLVCNIAGVRNLGAMECQTEWMVILDMDTMISIEMAKQLIELVQNNQENTVYKFNRKVIDNPKHPKNNKMHPAICLIKKEDYWNIGGCEEDLVGNYGSTDPCFWHRAKNKVNIKYMENIYLIYEPEGEAEINRDKSINKKKAMKFKKKNNWSNSYVRFKWGKIY